MLGPMLCTTFASPTLTMNAFCVCMNVCMSVCTLFVLDMWSKLCNGGGGGGHAVCTYCTTYNEF